MAAVVELVQDFDTTPAGSHYDGRSVFGTLPVTMNGISFFAAIDESHGQELWRSDGTGEGTFRITDLVPGPGHSSISELTVVGNTLYFRAMDRMYHHELWATDGTVEGTRELRRESEPDFAAYALTAWNDDLVFASSVANQTFLYSTDGTAIGTRQLATLTSVDQIVSADDGTLYIVDNILSQTGNNHHSEIWKSDGTQVGTQLVLPYAGGGSINAFTVGNRLYWTDTSLGFVQIPYAPQLLTWDGQSDYGTPLSNGYSFVSIGNKLYFASEDGTPSGKLKVTEGTIESTVDVAPNKRFRPGAFARVGETFYFLNSQVYFGEITEVGSDYFDGRSGIGKSDGTESGTVLIQASDPYSENPIPVFNDIVAVGGSLLLKADNWPHSPDLWLYEISTGHLTRFAGTAPLWDLYGSGKLQSLGDLVFFPAEDSQHGVELWMSDGTVEGTRLVKDIATGTSSSQLMPTGVTDNGELITGEIRPVDSSSRPEIRYRDMRVYAEFLSTGKDRIWAVRAGSTEPELLHLTDSWVSKISSLQDAILFLVVDYQNSRQQIWTSDGTVDGTRRLMAVPPLPNIDSVGNWTVIDDRVMFTVMDELTGVREIWVSDGTDEGTFRIRHNMESSLHPLNFGRFIQYRDGIAFAASTTEVGGEIFRINTSISVQPPVSLSLSRTAERTFISWPDGRGAIEYDVWMQNLSDASVVRRRVHSPELELNSETGMEITSGVDDAAWKIWVRSVAVLGETSPWSRSFEIAPDNKAVMHGIPALSVNALPVFHWTGPQSSGSNQTVSYEFWLTNRDTKTRSIYRTGLQTATYAVSEVLAPGKYAVWVRATRANGTKSDWSDLKEFEILAPPVQLQSGIGDSRTARPRFSWAAVADATSYEVQVTSSESDALIYSAGNITDLSHQPGHDIPPGKFKVSVRAMRGSRPLSAWGVGDALWLKLAPTGLRHSDTDVLWNPVPFARSYTLQIRDGNGQVVVTMTTQTATSVALPENLRAGQYVVRVFANFANMSSDWSGAHNFEVFHPPVAVNPIASETADATPVIAWDSLTGAATYEVIVTRSLSQVPVYLRSGITGTAHRVSVAIANGIYLIQVRAIFADGSRSALSNAQRVTIGSAPELAFSSGEVTWNAVNQATHFELWLNRIGTAPKAKVVHTPVYVGTSFVPPASLPKGRYQIWLRAIRAEAGETYFGSWAALEFDLL